MVFNRNWIFGKYLRLSWSYNVDRYWLSPSYFSLLISFGRPSCILSQKKFPIEILKTTSALTSQHPLYTQSVKFCRFSWLKKSMGSCIVSAFSVRSQAHTILHFLWQIRVSNECACAKNKLKLATYWRAWHLVSTKTERIFLPYSVYMSLCVCVE